MVVNAHAIFSAILGSWWILHMQIMKTADERSQDTAMCRYHGSMCCSKIDASSRIPLTTWAFNMRHHPPGMIETFTSLIHRPAPPTVTAADRGLAPSLWMSSYEWICSPTWRISQASLPPLPLLGHSTSWWRLLDVGDERGKRRRRRMKNVSPNKSIKRVNVSCLCVYQ